MGKKTGTGFFEGPGYFFFDWGRDAVKCEEG